MINEHIFDNITDLYLPTKDPKSGYAYPDRHELTPDIKEVASELITIAKSKGNAACTVNFHQFSFRCQIFPTADGEMAILRKMPSVVLSLKNLGIPQQVAAHMMSPRLNDGGLILISGLPGSGKSTTAAALILERLRKFAGICLTVEDPIEMPLQGVHGEGYCLQRWVANENEFANAIRDTLRAYPAKTNGMMLIGETRDPETAALALRSAVDGRLVLTTIHAGSIVQAVQRICTMASRSMPMAEARELMASGFRMVLNQSLVESANGYRLVMQAMFDTQASAGVIRSKETFEALNTDIQHQQNLLRLGTRIEVRQFK